MYVWMYVCYVYMYAMLCIYVCGRICNLRSGIWRTRSMRCLRSCETSSSCSSNSTCKSSPRSRRRKVVAWLCVCMYVCMYVWICMYICMYLYVCMYGHILPDIIISNRKRAFNFFSLLWRILYVCMCGRTHTGIYVSINKCRVCMCVHA